MCIDRPKPKIDLPGVRNLRDLGGHVTRDGLIVAPQRLYRAEALVLADARESNAQWVDEHEGHYATLGLASVIDLRAEVEKATMPSGWAKPTGAAYFDIPINEGVPGTNTDLVGNVVNGTHSAITAQDLGEFYVHMLERRAHEFGTAFRTIATAEHHPVLVHCSAGKDRTGLVIALVLEALNVDREAIYTDYQLTGTHMPDRVNLYTHNFGEVGVELDAVRAMFETPRQALAVAFEHLDTNYGSPAGYLQERAAVDHSVTESLRTAMLIERTS